MDTAAYRFGIMGKSTNKLQRMMTTMTNEQKSCLFCEKIVLVKRKEDRLVFVSCFCSGSGEYTIEDQLYERLKDIPPAEKRERYYLLSSLIRETLSLGKSILLTEDNLPSLLASPLIPETIEEKTDKCLLYLYRSVEGPEQAVDLRPVDRAYNITYSPSLQEFVYIVEKLKGQKWLERQGSFFRLTSEGWEQARRLSENRQSKECFLVVPPQESAMEAFRSAVVPKLEQSGYKVLLLEAGKAEGFAGRMLISAIRDCDLFIADYTAHSPEIYYATGIARTLGVKSVYTIHCDFLEGFPLAEEEPLPWEQGEDLADKLLDRLGASVNAIK
jgi:hypothetical protein